MSDFDITLIGKVDKTATTANVNKTMAEISKVTNQLGLGNVTGIKKDFDGLSESTEKFKGAIIKTSDATGNMSKLLVGADGNVKKVTTSTKALTKETGLFGKEMVKNAGKFISWTLLTTALYSTLAGMKALVEQVKELDDAMTELSKVTSLSSSGLARFKSEAEAVGKSINATTANIVQASSDFARMGFNEETSLSLAKDALLLTKIADGITEASEATVAMIAILKGFNLQASESGHILDALNEVSNNFAIGTDDLAEGLRRISGVMYQANVSFEETIGLLVGANESMQNIEKSSSGLITMSTRLRGVGEDGEAIEGLMPKLQKSFKEYADIDIQNSNGELRSTYDILVDLSGKWDTLSSKEQSYLGFLASGQRQTPVLNALMANLGNTVGATATAYDSAGSAQLEFTKVMESLQGRLDKLGATWSRISNDFVSSDFLKGLLTIADGFSNIIEVVGLLNVAILALSTIISVKTLSVLPALATKVIALAESMGIATGASITLGAAMSGLALGAAVIGIIAVVKIIDTLIVTQSEWNAKLEESTSKITSLKDEIELLNKQALDLKGVDDAELKLLEKELEIKQQLLDIEIQRNAETLDKTIADESEKLGAPSADASSATNIGVLGDVEDQKDLLGALEIVNFELERMEELRLKATSPSEFEHFSGVISDLTEIQLEHEKALLAQKKAIEAIPYDKQTEKLKAQREEIQKALGVSETLEELVEKENNLRKEQVTSVEEVTDAVEEEVIELEDLMDSMSSLSSTYAKLNKGEKLSVESLNDLIEKYPEYASEILTVNNSKEAGMKVTELLFEIEKKRSLNVLLQTKAEIKAKSALFAVDKERIRLLSIYEGTDINTGGLKSFDKEIRAINAQIQIMNQTTIGGFEGASEAAETSSKSVSSTADSVEEVVVAFEDLSEEIEKNHIDTVDKYQDAIINALELEIDAIDEAKDAYEELADSKIEAIEDAIDSMDEEKTIAEELLNIKEAELAVTEAQLKLDNVSKEKTEKLLTENGFINVANQDDVLSAQEDLDSAVNTLKDAQETKVYNDSIRALEAQKDFLEDQKAIDIKGFEDRQEVISNHIDEIENFETDSYLVRLNNLDAFVEQYNSTYSQLSSDSVTSARSSNSGSTGVKAQSDNTTVKNYLQEMSDNSSAWNNSTSQGKINLAQKNQDLADKIAKETGTRPLYDSASGEWDVLKYGTGGYLTEPELAIVGDENESIIPDKAMGVFISDAVEKVSQSLNVSPMDLGGNQTNTTNENGITIQHMEIKANNPTEFSRAMSRVSQYN